MVPKCATCQKVQLKQNEKDRKHAPMVPKCATCQKVHSQYLQLIK